MAADIAGERPLPGNPNCVVYAVPVERILTAGTAWRDVLRMAAAVAEPFHEACGLDVLVGLSWRVALDRKNNRTTQLTLYFVFDGPATAEHLDTLDETMRGSGMPWSQGNIERVPVHGIPAVLLSEGTVYQVWREHEGQPVQRRLQLHDGRVTPVPMTADEATPDHQLGVDHVLGVAAPYGDDERESERMRLAFARHFSQKIVEADGVVHDDEAAFMQQVFPAEILERLGLGDPAVEKEYLEAASESLKGILGYHDKLGLIGLFFSACYSDGSLDAREMRVLKDAGDVLGLSKEQIVKYLRRFW